MERNYGEITFTQEELYEAGMVRETASAYNIPKHQGEFTLEDYYSIPDEIRVELIDGVIYDMSIPTHIHQLIILEIYDVIKAHIKKKNGEYIVHAAPMDVQLDCDNRTMVQPDVQVICERKKLKKRINAYRFEKEELPVMYTFDDKVPVGIFDGECEVDFAEIYNYVKFLYEE